MSETLVGLDAKIWLLDHTSENMRSVCDYTANALADIIQDESAKNLFLEFVSKRRLPDLVSYLVYDSGHEQGSSEHQDVDSVFCTALLFIKNSTKGVYIYVIVIFLNTLISATYYSWILVCVSG